MAAAPSTTFEIHALPAKVSAPTPVSLGCKASSIFTQSAHEASTSTDEDAVYTADEGDFIIFGNSGTTNVAIMRIPCGWWYWWR